MKLVDTDDTVLIVTGIDVPAEMNDRPLAYRLKAEIDRRGAGRPFRNGLVVSTRGSPRTGSFTCARPSPSAGPA